MIAPSAYKPQFPFLSGLALIVLHCAPLWPSFPFLNGSQ